MPELMESGSKQAFFRLKEVDPEVCHLYALEGAVQNVEFNSLSEETKRDLKGFSDFLKGSGLSKNFPCKSGKGVV